jgi:hypothetical protein
MRHAMKIVLISSAIAMTAVAALPGVSGAAKLTEYNLIMNMEFGYDQGVVTAISPKGDYFSVNGRTMFLVECTDGGASIATSFHGLHGEDITLADIKPGDHVLVYGGALKDDTRAAKDVFVTSGKMKASKRKSFTSGKKLKTWRDELRVK